MRRKRSQAEQTLGGYTADIVCDSLQKDKRAQEEKWAQDVAFELGKGFSYYLKDWKYSIPFYVAPIGICIWRAYNGSSRNEVLGAAAPAMFALLYALCGEAQKRVLFGTGQAQGKDVMKALEDNAKLMLLFSVALGYVGTALYRSSFMLFYGLSQSYLNSLMPETFARNCLCGLVVRMGVMYPLVGGRDAIQESLRELIVPIAVVHGPSAPKKLALECLAVLSALVFTRASGHESIMFTSCVRGGHRYFARKYENIQHPILATAVWAAVDNAMDLTRGLLYSVGCMLDYYQHAKLIPSC